MAVQHIYVVALGIGLGLGLGLRFPSGTHHAQANIMIHNDQFSWDKIQAKDAYDLSNC